MTTDTARALVSALKGFDIDAEVAEVQTGAAVDRYALKLKPGTKYKRVEALADDIALAIAAPSVRILPISGTQYVGVEVPAAERAVVTLASLAPDQDHPLRFPVGVDVAGAGVTARVDKLPHLIVAGQTGSGKSVGVTAILAHLVTHAEPSQLRLLLVDPKRVELAAFAGIRHLYRPVVTDTAEAPEALEDVVAEMDRRWKMLEDAGRKHVADLPEPPPYLVVVIDELADLMMTAGKRVEGAIVRLLQLGRAAGIHLILATQRPSTDVITGLIKTNAPSRLVFAVSSHTDSNVALGQSGAERLLGAGDGLWWPAGASQPERIQSPYVGDDELEEMLTPLRPGVTPAPGQNETPLDRLEKLRRQHLDKALEGLDEPKAPPAPKPDPEPWPHPPVPVTRFADAPTAPTPEEAPPFHPLDPERPTPEELARTLTYERRQLDEAYEAGRRQAYLEMATPHRTMGTRDWVVAVLVTLAAFAVGTLAFPFLIPAFAGWAGWTVTRRRTKMTTYPLERNIR